MNPRVALATIYATAAGRLPSPYDEDVDPEQIIKRVRDMRENLNEYYLLENAIMDLLNNKHTPDWLHQKLIAILAREEPWK